MITTQFSRDAVVRKYRYARDFVFYFLCKSKCFCVFLIKTCQNVVIDSNNCKENHLNKKKSYLCHLNKTMKYRGNSRLFHGLRRHLWVHNSHKQNVQNIVFFFKINNWGLFSRLNKLVSHFGHYFCIYLLQNNMS